MTGEEVRRQVGGGELLGHLLDSTLLLLAAVSKSGSCIVFPGGRTLTRCRHKTMVSGTHLLVL